MIGVRGGVVIEAVLCLYQRRVPDVSSLGGGGGGKGGRCVRLTTLPPSCADWLEIGGAFT
jgi:hypothetical protein